MLCNRIARMFILTVSLSAILQARTVTDDSTFASSDPIEALPQRAPDLLQQLNWDGLTLSVVVRADQLANAVGGRHRGLGVMCNVDLSAELDGEKLFGWEESKGLVHVLGNSGGSLNRFVGDAQMASNIESTRQLKIYQAWIEKGFRGGTVSLLAGLYDLNSEFYATRTAGIFLNSSHGVGKEMSQSGKNGPSIFPNTAATLRIRFRPSDEISLQAAVVDGVPGSPDDPCCPSLCLSSDEGALIVGELSYEIGGEVFCKYSVGSWFYTSRTDRINTAGPAPSSDFNRGYYVMAEQQLSGEEGSGTQGLAAFLRFGMAQSSVNQFDFDLGAGLLYTGLFSGRDDDALGLAVANAHNGDAFRSEMLSQGLPLYDAEVAFELTYRARITSWLAVQPDIQYIVHPGTDPLLPDALIVGARIETRF